ncbi:sodium-coupled monocarboxylate transporter 2-like [Amblyomma americanum]
MPKRLDAADCAMFGILTALGYLVGLYFSLTRCRHRPAASGGGAAEEACLAGRSLPAFALAVSVMASVANGLSVVGFVGHFYAYGFNVMWVLAGIPAAACATAATVVPLFHGLRVTSVFQYLRMRFDNKVGITACIIYFVLSQTLGAVGIYSAAVAVSTMFPVPLLYSNVAIGLAGTIYTALGGLRGVVWADCVQALVMLASPLTIIGKVLYDARRASPPLRSMADFNVAEYAFRTELDTSSDENIWSNLVGAIPFCLVRVGFDQMAVQRFVAARTAGDAKRIAVVGGGFVLFFFVIVACSAAAIVYWYRDCDPLQRGAIHSYDQIVPYYMMESLSDVTTLRGLFLAGILGASTSTVSSVVNSHAAIFYVDMVAPYVKMSDKKAANVVRLLAASSGAVMTAFAIAVPVLGTATRLFLSLYSSAAGPFAGLLLLAISSPWVNAKGAAWASLLVCGLQLWHAVGRSLASSGLTPTPFLPLTLDRCPGAYNGTAEEPPATSASALLLLSSSPVFPLYRLSFLWVCCLGALLTLLLGTVLSIATGGLREATRNLRLTCPVFLDLWRRFRVLRRVLEPAERTLDRGASDDDEGAHTAFSSNGLLRGDPTTSYELS